MDMSAENVKWYQFRIPIDSPDRDAIGGITDIRSVRFARLYLNDFTQNTVLRFATLDLVRSDWRRYKLALDGDCLITMETIQILRLVLLELKKNEGYQIPPGVE